jgi:STE24 endopeptidase
VLVAEGAVLLLRPESRLDPVAVRESAYFTMDQLDRARDYAGGQRLLGIAGIAVEGALLALLVVRPPRRAVRLAERAARQRPLAACAVAGAGLALAVDLVALPLSAAAHARSVDVGLATQAWPQWSWDWVKSAAIGAGLAAAGAAVFCSLIRRFPRRWWVPGSAVAVAVSVVFVWLAPVVLDPLFSRYEKLPAGRARDDVTELARRAGVDVGGIYVVDASRRTRTANAYVTGIGHTKRVVLYDNLLERFTPAQTRLVVAHELAHVEHHDLRRGLVWVALVAPPAMYLAMLLTERWSRRADVAPGSAGSLPALALALAVVTFGGTVVSNQLSRRVEARADERSLELTREPGQFIRMQRRLALANLADPDPPALTRQLFRTHPTTLERIGAGLAFEREQGRAGSGAAGSD